MTDGESDLEDAVQYRLQVLRINREARRRLDDEERPPLRMPPIKSLANLLAEPDNPTRYRIEGLAPADSRIMLSAQYKAGKTIIVGNLLRSLADGDPFLGRFTVNTPATGAVLIDNELSEDTLRYWLRDQHIVNTGAVADVVSLRGRVGTFDLLDDRCRDLWATRLRHLRCDYLILDCLRPVLDALGLSEDKDAGRFLTALDTLLTDAGIADAAIVHHMGHANERSRGDSRLQDWPDAIWRLVRETDQPDSARYFSAYGRDVNVHEGRLSYAPATRRLTYAAGSRADAKTEAAKKAVIAILADDATAGGEGMSGRSIEDAIDGGHPQKAIRDAIREVIDLGLVVVEKGDRRAHLHRIANPCAVCGMPVVAGQGSRHELCARKATA